MAFSGTIEQARRSMNATRSYLDTGEAINWVPDELLLIESNAIDAWLAATNQNPDGCQTTYDYEQLFYKTAPKDLVEKFRNFTSGWPSLGFALEGDEYMDPMPMSEWKKLAYSYLDKAEIMIQLIEESIAHQLDQP